MSNVRTKVKNVENDYKIYSECTKMPTKENEPSLTDIMNELKSFKNETNARFAEINTRLDKHDERFDSIDNRLDSLENKLNNVIKLNNLEV